MTHSSPIRIYVIKIENWIQFKIINNCYLDLLSSEITKLLESTNSKVNKDKNGENVPHLEITKVA